jgi:hypothetical protein
MVPASPEDALVVPEAPATPKPPRPEPEAPSERRAGNGR